MGQIPEQREKKNDTSTSLPCISAGVRVLPSCVVKVKFVKRRRYLGKGVAASAQNDLKEMAQALERAARVIIYLMLFSLSRRFVRGIHIHGCLRLSSLAFWFVLCQQNRK